MVDNHAARHKAQRSVIIDANAARFVKEQRGRIGHNQQLAERVANNIHGSVSEKRRAVGKVLPVKVEHSFRVHNPGRNHRSLVAELRLTLVQVQERHSIFGRSQARSVMHDGGLRGKRGVGRAKAGIQHIGQRIDGQLLPKGRACDFRVLLNPFELAGVKANRRRTGCNLNHCIDKMRHVLFGDVAGTVSVTATNKPRNLGEKGNVGIIALMRSRAKLNRPACCGIE